MSRRTLMLTVGASLAVLMIWYFVLWSPRSAALEDAKERQDAAQLRQDDLRLRIGRLKAAQRDEPAKRARLEVLRAAVPDEPNLAQFILDTNDAATRAGIDFLSIAPTQPGAGQPDAPAAITLNLSVAGGYFQVLDFMNRLTTSPRLIVIDSINVGGITAQGRLSIGLNAKMFTAGGSAPPLSAGGAGAGTTTTTTAPGSASTTSTSTASSTPTTGAP